MIDRETVRAGDVISNLLSFGSDREMTLSQMMIGDVINDSVSSLVIRENINVSVIVEPNLPPVLGDGSQLIRALQNLAENAQDAINGHGNITVEAERKEGSVQIRVSDSGSGINEENLESIFEPLYTAKSHGTGLGLAICREIVGRHKGTISVESTEGTGTTFTIEIPIAA